jgi:hypothetical protein
MPLAGTQAGESVPAAKALAIQGEPFVSREGSMELGAGGGAAYGLCSGVVDVG